MSFIWWVLWLGCMRGKPLTAGNLSEAMGGGPLPRGQENKGEVLGKRRIGESVMSLHDVAQQHNRVSGQRALKGRSSVGSFISTELILPVASRCGVLFLWGMQSKSALSG